MSLPFLTAVHQTKCDKHLQSRELSQSTGSYNRTEISVFGLLYPPEKGLLGNRRHSSSDRLSFMLLLGWFLLVVCQWCAFVHVPKCSGRTWVCVCCENSLCYRLRSQLRGASCCGGSHKLSVPQTPDDLKQSSSHV